ncbi:unnamed protein product, partial [Laminaria digitata]
MRTRETAETAIQPRCLGAPRPVSHSQPSDRAASTPNLPIYPSTPKLPVFLSGLLSLLEHTAAAVSRPSWGYRHSSCRSFSARWESVPPEIAASPGLCQRLVGGVGDHAPLPPSPCQDRCRTASVRMCWLFAVRRHTRSRCFF